MTDFLDSATISGVTSLSTTEVASNIESNTISGKATPSSSENTARLDSATIANLTTPSDVETNNLIEAATFSSTTSLVITEETTTETLLVNETYSGLAVGDTVSFVVSSTTTTTTSTTDTPPPPPTNITLAVTVATTDYNNQSWIAAYSYNSDAAITAGTQASFDGDDGLIPIAT